MWKKLKENRWYRKLKEWEQDRTLCRTRWGWGFGPAVRQIAEWMNVKCKVIIWFDTVLLFRCLPGRANEDHGRLYPRYPVSGTRSEDRSSKHETRHVPKSIETNSRTELSIHAKGGSKYPHINGTLSLFFNLLAVDESPRRRNITASLVMAFWIRLSWVWCCHHRRLQYHREVAPLHENSFHL